MRDVGVPCPMYREIAEQGYTGSNTAVGRFLAPLRAAKGKARSAQIGRT